MAASDGLDHARQISVPASTLDPVAFAADVESDERCKGREKWMWRNADVANGCRHNFVADPPTTNQNAQHKVKLPT